MNYVISLGGSIINPGKINIKFLTAFRDLILSFSKKGHRFFIVTGGGQVARDNQQVARLITKPSLAELDWIGIAATKINAELLRTIFGQAAYAEVISNPTRKIKDPKKINIFSGWKPGWSTDYVAVKIAETYGVRTVINLSNIDYVYDRDPRQYKNARKFKRLTWKEFNQLFSNKWQPGTNMPFDPVAARLAGKLGIGVIVMDGRKLENIRKFISQKFRAGTVIG